MDYKNIIMNRSTYKEVDWDWLIILGRIILILLVRVLVKILYKIL